MGSSLIGHLVVRNRKVRLRIATLIGYLVLPDLIRNWGVQLRIGPGGLFWVFLARGWEPSPNRSQEAYFEHFWPEAENLAKIPPGGLFWAFLARGREPRQSSAQEAYFMRKYVFSRGFCRWDCENTAFSRVWGPRGVHFVTKLWSGWLFGRREGPRGSRYVKNTCFLE